MTQKKAKMLSIQRKLIDYSKRNFSKKKKNLFHFVFHLRGKDLSKLKVAAKAVLNFPQGIHADDILATVWPIRARVFI